MPKTCDLLGVRATVRPVVVQRLFVQHVWLAIIMAHQAGQQVLARKPGCPACLGTNNRPAVSWHRLTRLGKTPCLGMNINKGTSTKAGQHVLLTNTSCHEHQPGRHVMARVLDFLIHGLSGRPVDHKGYTLCLKSKSREELHCMTQIWKYVKSMCLCSAYSLHIMTSKCTPSAECRSYTRTHVHLRILPHHRVASSTTPLEPGCNLQTTTANQFPTTFRPPSNHAPTTSNHPPTTFRPPSDHSPTTLRPPPDHLPTTSRPPPTTSQPPPNHLPTSLQPRKATVTGTGPKHAKFAVWGYI